MGHWCRHVFNCGRRLLFIMYGAKEGKKTMKKNKEKTMWGILYFVGGGKGWQLMTGGDSKNKLLQIVNSREEKFHDSERCIVRKLTKEEIEQVIEDKRKFEEKILNQMEEAGKTQTHKTEKLEAFDVQV